MLKKGEMPMPIELSILLKDGSSYKFYIPTVLMRGEKELNESVNVLPDWPWTNPFYPIRLDKVPSEIKEIQLHTTGHIADIEPLNDKVIIPKNWNWKMYKLRLKIIEKKKKGKTKKFVRIKK